MRVRASSWKPVAVAMLSLSLAGCVRGCTSSLPPIHPNPNMDYQEKYQAQEESAFFYDGMTMRTPVEGTIARGALRENESLYTGRDAEGEFLAALPVEASDTLMARGAARYDIYCRPCHDKRGEGQGIMTERGGVPVPSYGEQRVRDLPDGEIFDVITNGKGLMQGYRYPVPASDRWAIVAHVRELQRELETADVAQAR